ncbi:MAG: sulfite exporter TauE/SafE family protein [Bacteroidetes bacterium]|nr:sulfite exporter TauE/SafE family protein [Bacteroidota bacterium]
MPLDPATLLTLLAIGLFAGVASGFVGVGGGLILVPAMMVFLGLGQHAAQGTSLAMMLPPVGILAVMQYHKAGEVHWAFAAVLCLTFVVGAWGGSKLSLRLSEGWVKLVFGLVMLYASVRMLFKAWAQIQPTLFP